MKHMMRLLLNIDKRGAQDPSHLGDIWYKRRNEMLKKKKCATKKGKWDGGKNKIHVLSATYCGKDTKGDEATCPNCHRLHKVGERSRCNHFSSLSIGKDGTRHWKFVYDPDRFLG
jgi:hypothetical protein